MQKNHSKLIVLLLAVAMIFVLSACGSNFLSDGWDHEANGVRYGAGFGGGQIVNSSEAAQHNVAVNADGSGGVVEYSLKGPDVNGDTYNVDGSPQSLFTTTKPIVQQ